jgi:hypothetical protein
LPVDTLASPGNGQHNWLEAQQIQQIREQNVPREKIKHDALLGQPHGPAKGFHVPPTGLVLAVVEVDLDVAVVDIAPGEGGPDDGRVLHLAVLVGWAQTHETV